MTDPEQLSSPPPTPSGDTDAYAPFTPPPQPSAPWVKGYFAFPPILNPDGSTSFAFHFHRRTPSTPFFSSESGPSSPSPHPDSASSPEQRAKDAAWAARLEQEAAARAARRERERAEALRSEIEWVRAGGALRDARGRRDPARTAALRREIELKDKEDRLRARWDAYEARWRVLSDSRGRGRSESREGRERQDDAADGLAFADVPWPVDPAPADVSDLTRVRIADFLLEPLSIRGNTVTRRERIRASLLRWHPDKVSMLLARVRPIDAERVMEGVYAVFRALKEMQDEERGT